MKRVETKSRGLDCTVEDVLLGNLPAGVDPTTNKLESKVRAAYSRVEAAHSALKRVNASLETARANALFYSLMKRAAQAHKDEKRSMYAMAIPRAGDTVLEACVGLLRGAGMRVEVRNLDNCEVVYLHWGEECPTDSTSSAL